MAARFYRTYLAGNQELHHTNWELIEWAPRNPTSTSRMILPLQRLRVSHFLFPAMQPACGGYNNATLQRVRARELPEMLGA